MHSSKIKKATKIVVKLLVFLVICGIVSNIIGYFVLPAKSYTRIQFHELYTTYGNAEDSKNMDLVFLGTSHAYRTFDTEYFDEKLNMETYNFGTSQQTLEGSYYVLKEILKTNQPKKVVFELTYTCFNEKDYNPLKSVIIYQYMKPSLDKLKYLMADFPLENIFNALIPAYTFREYLTADDIAPKILDKSTDEYKNYDPAITQTQTTEWMEEKGFIYTDMEFYNGWVGKTDPEAWTEQGMDTQKLEYLNKIIHLCKDNGIDLVLVTSPNPRGTLLEVGNYNEINEYFTNIAENNGIDYYNLNLIRPEILNLSDSEFYDATHVNGEGAQKVSQVFSDILKDREEGTLDYNRYFYENFEEAEKNITKITNAYYDITEDDSNYYLTAKAYIGDGSDIEFQYLEEFKDETGRERIVLQDWSFNSEFILPKEGCEGRRIIVAARVAGSDLDIDSIETQKSVTEFPVIIEEEE